MALGWARKDAGTSRPTGTKKDERREPADLEN